MTALCNFYTCRAPAKWRLSTTCECVDFRCDTCKAETEEVIAEHLAVRGRNGVCARCRHRLDPATVTWSRVVDEPPVDEQLEAAMLAAIAGLTVCGMPYCQRAADCQFKAPCGHDTPLCQPCARYADQARAQLIANGEPFVCTHDNEATGWWAETRWEEIA
jgi:hypothetical protein